MAENEKKSQELEAKKADKPADKKADKPQKPKSDKPGITTRVANWFRATRAELKKIVWTPKDALIRNTILTLVAMAAFGLVIGLLDVVFTSAITALGKLI